MKELEAMTPEERTRAAEGRTITNLDELPSEFRQKMIETEKRLAEARRSAG